MLIFVNKFFQNLVSYIYPSFCWQCLSILDSEQEVFCIKCWSGIKSLPYVKLKITNEESLKVFIAAEYSLVIRKLVFRKYASDICASKHLGEIIYKNTDIKNMHFNYIVPIPLYWTRYASRGFNQAVYISKILQKKLHIPIVNLLKRIKSTKFQSMLSKQQRRDNLENAFSLNDKVLEEYYYNFEDKDLLLVDDLCTTGITLITAAQELLRLKPKSITAVVVCRKI